MLFIPEESPFASNLNQLKTMHTYTTQAEIRSAFWGEYPRLEQEARRNGTLSKGQNAQTTTCRTTFVGWVDWLERSGSISFDLAQRVTL
jgi:hypothetical protein